MYICGLGASGEAVARLARQKGANVVLVDRGDSPELRRRAKALESEGVAVELGCSLAEPGDAEWCVVSPGIARDSEWLSVGRVPLVSTLEYAWHFVECPVVAVTGSNGKSTFLKLCADALTQAGQRVVIAGNYGRPLADVILAGDEWDRILLEVSSFQLETMNAFRPEVGVWLNLLPNHLDRHRTLEVYAGLKASMFARQGLGDVAIVGEDLCGQIEGARTFGVRPDSDFRISDGFVQGPDVSLDLSGTLFESGVLSLAATGVAAVLGACGVGLDHLRSAAEQFEPLPHRLAVAGKVGDVTFINDSKATNLAALAAAVDLQASPVRLIAGGILKEKDLESIKELLAKHVASVYLIGEAAEELAQAWGDLLRCTQSHRLEQAVSEAWRESDPGDVVLFSPGCASFDQFASFADRGNAFLECVRALKKEK